MIPIRGDSVYYINPDDIPQQRDSIAPKSSAHSSISTRAIPTLCSSLLCKLSKFQLYFFILCANYLYSTSGNKSEARMRKTIFLCALVHTINTVLGANCGNCVPDWEYAPYDTRYAWDLRGGMCQWSQSNGPIYYIAQLGSSRGIYMGWLVRWLLLGCLSRYHPIMLRK
jgi:hypothetical protein